MNLPSKGILEQIMEFAAGTHLSITLPKLSCIKSKITYQSPTGGFGFKIYQR